MSFFSFSKRYNGVAEVFLRSPEIYRPLLEFLEVVMRGESDLSRSEREILATRVSILNGCDFCVQAHIATLKASGIPDAELQQLKSEGYARTENPKMQALLVFTEKLTQAPDAVGQHDIDVLTQAGIGEQAIEDTVNVVALFNYVNRLVDAFGVKGDPKYFDHIGQALSRNGYANLLPAKSEAWVEMRTKQ